MSKTNLQKEIKQGVADKLLVKDASNWALVKALHKSRGVTMLVRAIIAGVTGYVLGMSI